MRRLVLCVACITAACAFAVASSAGARTVARCGPAGAHQLTADAQARVYVTAHGVYGCVPDHRAVQLGGSTTRCLGAERIGPVALAGTTAAYASERCGIDTGSTSLIVKSLTSGRQISSSAGGTPPGAEFYTTVTSIVVRTDGAAAWIAVSRSLGAMESKYEVWRVVHRTAQRLEIDLSGVIATHSLRLHGGTITWRSGGQLRSASLG